MDNQTLDVFLLETTKETLRHLQEVNKRNSDVLGTIGNSLSSISQHLEDLDDIKDRVEVNRTKIAEIMSKIKYVMLLVSVVGTFGIGTYVWVNHDIDKRIDKAVDTITSSRSDALKQGSVMYWIDEKGMRRTILIEKHDEDYNEAKNLPSKK